MYDIVYTEVAREHIAYLRKHDVVAFKKVTQLLLELCDHPTTGTGHPEKLKGVHVERWSRRISKKHRLVYEIHETEVIVLVLAAYGHYDDK